MNLGVELNAAKSPGSRGVQGTRGGDCARELYGRIFGTHP